MKLLAFFTDLGGCLFPDLLDAACAMVASRYAASPERIQLAKERLWIRYAYATGPDKGTLNHSAQSQVEAEAWSEFVVNAGIAAQPEEMIAIADQCVQPLDPAYETLLEQLQCAGVVLGIISNNTAFFWRRQCEAMRLNRYFPPERVILSCDHGVSKKSEGLQLFRTAVAAAAVPPQRCAFVDDRVHNIQCALRAGFGMAILHPKNIDWGAEYVGRILAQAGMLPMPNTHVADH